MQLHLTTDVTKSSLNINIGSFLVSMTHVTEILRKIFFEIYVDYGVL
jgi:hypothetical protein